MTDTKALTLEQIDELLPCPFCGGGNAEFHAGQSNWVECIYCSATVCEDDRETTVSAWNRRDARQATASAEREARLREALRIASDCLLDAHDETPRFEIEWTLNKVHIALAETEPKP